MDLRVLPPQRVAVALNVGGEEYDGPPVDALLALEVLEHIEDDVGALRTWSHNVNAGGAVIISVPAGEKLAVTDERQGHVRRYTHESLTAVIHGAGLTPVQVRGYGFPIGSALHRISNLVTRLRPRAETGTATSGRWMQPPPWLDPLYRVAASPFAIIQRAFPSRGSGLIALARRE